MAYVFGWGMVPHQLAVPIGGTTRGSEVVYSKPKAPISTSNKSNFEKDRDAILSLWPIQSRFILWRFWV